MCEAVLAEYDRSNIYLAPITGTQEKTTKLRPITRMPKKWSIYDVNPYAVLPYVTACDPAGKSMNIFQFQSRLPTG